MRAVSNTSPLFNLAAVGHLERLREQFEEIVVPDAVVRELRPVERVRGISSIFEALEIGWIRNVSAGNRELVQALRRDLDDGEAEAIALATELELERLLIDEREGREAARRMGLHPIGVLGVLLRAKRTRQVQTIAPILEDLQERAGFRIAPKLAVEVLVQAGEARGS